MKPERSEKQDPVLVLKEKVKVDLVLKLLASNLLDKDTKNLLYKYKGKIGKDGYVTVNYFTSKNLSKGRLYAEEGLSYQSFWRQMRHTLAHDIYYDIDMVNAAPTMLEQYCKKNQIECKYLSMYVCNRDKWLGEIMKRYNINRFKAKNLIIRLLYLGEYKILKEDYKKNEDDINEYEPEYKIQKVVNFSKELHNIADQICRIEYELKKEIETYKKNKSESKIKKSLMSILCHVLENDCMLHAVDFFKSKNYKVGVLCFDGFMIEKKDLGITTLKDCSSYVQEKTGYKLIFENKKMDEIMEIPKETAFVKDDKEVQEKLFRLEGKDYFKYCQDVLYVFSETTGKFEECSRDNETPLQYYISKHEKHFYIESPRSKFEQLKNYARDTILLKKIFPFVILAAKDDEWLDRTSSSSLRYLLFKNGIYNMDKKTFGPFDPTIVFHYKIYQDYTERNEENIKYAYDMTFKLICGDVGDDGHDLTKVDLKNKDTIPLSLPLRIALAKSLAGIKSKKFYLCPGKSNAGKSKLVDAITNCFGGFVQPFNAENLAYNDKGSQDQAQKNRWAYLIRYARLIFSNEVNMKATLNGNDIKKMSSGGDALVGRTHGKEEVSFVPHFTPFCMLNDIPAIEPMDEALRLRLTYYEFKKQFTMGEIEDPSYQIKADPLLEEKMREKKFINGFTHLMLDAYNFYLINGELEFDQKAKEDWIDGNDKEEQVYQIILEEYEITKNMNDFITVGDFNYFRKINKKVFETISLKRVNEILEKEGIQKDRGAKGVRIMTGIKRRDPNN